MLLFVKIKGVFLSLELVFIFNFFYFCGLLFFNSIIGGLISKVLILIGCFIDLYSGLSLFLRLFVVFVFRVVIEFVIVLLNVNK